MPLRLFCSGWMAPLSLCSNQPRRRGLGAEDAWKRLLGRPYQPRLCQPVYSFIIHTNRVGYEDGLHFWGSASVYDPNGDVLGRGPYGEESLTFVKIDLNQLHRTRARLPLLRDERTALVQREMDRILSGLGSASGR